SILIIPQAVRIAINKSFNFNSVKKIIMKRILVAFLFLVPVLLNAQIQYPETKKDSVTDDYNGVKVADPYRWLEDDNSEQTKSWVQEQNKVTQDYLSQIPYRDKVKKRMEEMWN